MPIPSAGRRLPLALALALTMACGGGDLPDPQNELPIGYLDSPANGAVVPRQFRFAGWALDDSRVVRVDIYVDGRFRASATPTVARPDVLKAYPQYAKSTAVTGWEVTVDLGEGAGGRAVLVQAVDDKGATRDIGSAAISIAK
jgi:N-acetylmuramoyl-L-alanine amidase